FNGRTGYIAGQFVSTGGQRMGHVTATLLNVRQLPSTTARVIAQLPRGSVVTIFSTANGWHYIRFGNGQMGYVSAEFVQ
ncbi:MAG: SH3 domain-containing protein, partial [Clostridia bacterium]|nr:SH3 domain-containing protein [Clostridia bacterium]